MFWDGFQWVSRTKPLVQNFEQVTNTKKIQISNIPLELGLRAEDIKRDFNKKIKEKYKIDKDLIQTATLIVAQNAAALELSSKDDIHKIKETFEGMKLLGQSLKVTSFEDKTINFNVQGNFSNTASSLTNLANPLANSAQTAAQAAAIANAALKGLQGQEVKITLQGMGFSSSTKILKVSNAIDPVDFQRLGNELQEIQMDMKEKFESFGKLIDIRMVLPTKETLGGNLNK